MDAEELRTIIAAQIRSRAKARRLSVVALAERAEVGASHLYAVLAGQRDPTVSWLLKVAVALDCEPMDLLRKPRKKSTAPKAQT